jgi:ribosomal protein S18 acetylase RimI-like enzyme
MTNALYTDKNLVINILTESFADNKSINYILKQDGKKAVRLKRLMDYSFDACYRSGEILLSNDKKACALIIFPDKKRITLKSIIADVKLMFMVTGLNKAKKAMQREAAIKKLHPKELIAYLWFIGVENKEQGKGIGSSLIKEIIGYYNKLNKTICLETSTPKNIPWYQKFGFCIYKELDFGYTLYCMKRE